MSINSYAQNFEDVMLWRALGHIEHGFYIDIGAQDPVVDSVSLAFYEHGWRGIHVEPTPHYDAEMLREQRPGDTVIQAAVAEVPGVMQFMKLPYLVLLCRIFTNRRARMIEDFKQQLAPQQEAVEKLERLHAEQVAREAVYCKRIAETQLQIESMLRTFVQREQEFAQQLFKVQHEAEETRRAAEQSWFEQQKSLSQELAQSKERQRQEYDALLHTRIQREKEFVVQLLAQQQSAEKKQESLRAEHARRETILIEQLHEQNIEHCRLEQSWTEQQKTLRQEFSALQEKLNSEILRRHDELQAAERVRQLQAEQYDRDLAVREAEHQQRLQALNAIAAQLHGQLQGEREALTRIRTSLLWRMTTPLRALASIFVPTPSSDPSSQPFEPQYLADINRLLAGNPHIANVHSELREFIVPSPSQPDTITTVAATLDELLALHDRAFVQCAYLTLLGRAADPDGLQYYGGRLRQGISKIQILTQLRKSAEGKNMPATFRGWMRP